MRSIIKRVLEAMAKIERHLFVPTNLRSAAYDDRPLPISYENISVKHKDGYKCWTEHLPFDAIIVTEAPTQIPRQLLGQLKIGGRMVVPLDSVSQEPYLITRTKSCFNKKSIAPVRFAPILHGK